MGRKRLLKILLVFLAVSLLCGCFFWYGAKRNMEEEEESLRYTAENEANKFRQELEYYIQATGYLESMLVSSEGDTSDSADFSEFLVEEYAGLVEIWLAPENVVKEVYPEDEGVNGLDVSTLSGLPMDAESFIGSGNTIILGPVRLEVLSAAVEANGGNGSSTSYLQQLLTQEAAADGYEVTGIEEYEVSEEIQNQLAGKVFIIYNPVYINGEFWGCINAVVNAYTVFADSGMLALDDAGYNYMVYQMNENFDLYNVLACGDELTDPAESLFLLGGWEWSVDCAVQPGRVSKGFGLRHILVSLGLGALFALLYMYRERHREEEELLKQEQEANKAKTEFVSRISHDIRTPIGAILNLTEFAKRDMDDKEKLSRDLDRIDSSGKFLLSLINDVLDISKVNSGKIELTPEVVDYDSYLRSISDLMETMCSEKNQKFVMESDHASGLSFMADKVRLRQVTLNLLSNAVKYSPENTTIRYTSTAEETGDMVNLTCTIRDEGIGMSEDFQKIMFDEFSQEYDNPLRDSTIQGTGLGLPIVKKLVDLMGGTLDVKSERTKGTEITVKLSFPKADVEAIEENLAEKAKEQEKLSGTILFAEDNEINAEIAGRIFEELGVTADHAANGGEAVTMFKQSPMNHYDAIFMDIQMPVMDGLQAAEAIRALDRLDGQAVPIIAMTADAFKEAMEKAKEAGMNEYITKPLDPAQIESILKKYIEE